MTTRKAMIEVAVAVEVVEAAHKMVIATVRRTVVVQEAVMIATVRRMAVAARSMAMKQLAVK